MAEIKAFCNQCQDEADAVEQILKLAGVKDEFEVEKAVAQARCPLHRGTIEE